MRREVRPSDRIYHYLYPKRTQNDPQSFTEHLNTNLVAEVRIETQRFYGGLETVEARYPGLNYTHAPHIKRLSYFPHHKKLFEAFRDLAFTESEILGLCRWEGTLWARQRYEKDEGVKVEDTTGNEIGPWVPPQHREPEAEKKPAPATRRSSRRISASNLNRRSVGSPSQTQNQRVWDPTTVARRQSAAHVVEHHIARPQSAPAPQHAESRDVEMHDTPSPELRPAVADDASSVSMPALDTPEPEGAAHHPLSLSPTEAFQRMQALAALRARGETIDAMDPEFEQYLKETAEAGDLAAGYEAAHTIASVMNSVAQSQGQASSTTNASNAPEVDVL